MSLMAVYWREDILASKDEGEKRNKSQDYASNRISSSPLLLSRTPMHLTLLFPTTHTYIHVGVTNSSKRTIPSVTGDTVWLHTMHPILVHSILLHNQDSGNRIGRRLDQEVSPPFFLEWDNDSGSWISHNQPLWSRSKVLVFSFNSFYCFFIL